MEQDRPREISAREDNPHVAEALAHVMKPHMDDAHLLEGMRDEAYGQAQGQQRSKSERDALWDKAEGLDQAANASRFAGDRAAKRARDQLEDPS